MHNVARKHRELLRGRRRARVMAPELMMREPTVCLRVCTRIRTSVCTCDSIYLQMSVGACKNLGCARTHTHTHTHTHTLTHIRLTLAAPQFHIITDGNYPILDT